jgi:hypothetical protein
MNVKLRVIPRPTSKSRSHIVFDSKSGSIMKGLADVPTYCCGGCGAPLVEGVHAKQFVDESQPIDSIGAHISPLRFPPGDYRITDTLAIPTEQITVLSVGPMVLSCGQCGASNEMISPNQLFDQAH